MKIVKRWKIKQFFLSFDVQFPEWDTKKKEERTIHFNDFLCIYRNRTLHCYWFLIFLADFRFSLFLR